MVAQCAHAAPQPPVDPVARPPAGAPRRRPRLLGRRHRPARRAGPADENWSSLGSFADGFHVEIQRTGEGTPPRWHVDIESDDIEAEVARLEALGARRHRYIEDGRFWQMLDPSGLVFCVVGIQTGEEFDRTP